MPTNNPLDGSGQPGSSAPASASAPGHGSDAFAKSRRSFQGEPRDSATSRPHEPGTGALGQRSPSQGVRLINEAIKRILLDILIRGHGDRLIGRWSPEPTIQQFLDQVPYLLDRINQFHLICSGGSLATTGASRGCASRHLARARARAQTSGVETNANNEHLDQLHGLIGLIGDRHHWLARTRDPLGLTPLHKAVLATNRPVVEYLVDRYADERAPAKACGGAHSSSPTRGWRRLIDAQDKYGRSPLHYAAALVGEHSEPAGRRDSCHRHRLEASRSRQDARQVFQFLLSKGASEGVRDFRGKLAHEYRCRPSQARAKCIIQLAHKMGAQYQANVFTRTLQVIRLARTDSNPNQLSSIEEAHSGVRQATNYEGGVFEMSSWDANADSVLLPARNRPSMSMSCTDLDHANNGPISAADGQQVAKNHDSNGLHQQARRRCNSTGDEPELANESPVTQLAGHLPRRDCGQNEHRELEPELSSHDRLSSPGVQDDTGPREHEFGSISSLESFNLNSGTMSNSSSDKRASATLEQTNREQKLKSLVNDRCKRPILNEKTRHLIQRSLREGSIEQINELLVEGYGQHLVELAPLTCWNQRCRHYVDKIVPNFLKLLDNLHESIALNQLDRARKLLISEPILARMNRPYRRASMNCLHLAVKLNSKPLVRWLLMEQFPELVASKDSNGATCLHWAAKSLQNDRLYCWLSEHFGAQLENVCDFKGKTAANYRQQAVRLASFEQLHPDEEQVAISGKASSSKVSSIESLLAKSQASQDRLRLLGSRSSLSVRDNKSRQARKSTIVMRTKTAHPDAGPRHAGAKCSSDRNRSDEPTKPASVEVNTLSVAASVAGPPDEQARSAEICLETGPNNNEEPPSSRLHVGPTGTSKLCEPSDREEAPDGQANGWPTSNSASSNSSLAGSMKSAISEAAAAGCEPKRRKLDELIVASIRANDFKKLQHLVLAGCGRRILANYGRLGSASDANNGLAEGPSIGMAMRQFLERNVVESLKTIEKIHETIHRCFAAHEEASTSACARKAHNQQDQATPANKGPSQASELELANSSFHRLCSLFASKSLMMARDQFGASSLHVALMRCDKRLVDYLLSRHPAIASGPDGANRSALHYGAIVVAAWRRHGDFKLTLNRHPTEAANISTLSCRQTSEEDKSNHHDNGDAIARNNLGFWPVDETCQLIYEQLLARFGPELLDQRDRFGLTCADYLVVGDTRGAPEATTHIELPARPTSGRIIEACCPNYGALLERYQYAIWREVDAPQTQLEARPCVDTDKDHPDDKQFGPEAPKANLNQEAVVIGAPPSSSTSLSFTSSSCSSSSSSSSSSSQHGGGSVGDCSREASRRPTQDVNDWSRACEASSGREQQLATSEELPAVGAPVCSWPAAPLDSSRLKSNPLADELNPSQLYDVHASQLGQQWATAVGQQQQPERRRRNRSRHRHRHRRPRNRRRDAHASQSVVGGIIVPTIIHNDNRDEIEAYDIIYRQPVSATPASAGSATGSLSNSSSSISLGSMISSSSSSSSELSQLATATSTAAMISGASPVQPLRSSSPAMSLRNSPNDSHRQSRAHHHRALMADRCLGADVHETSSIGNNTNHTNEADNDERVERLSNEFEDRVRREKNELRLKVDQIMREIKLSAKSDKSARFLASPNDLVALDSKLNSMRPISSDGLIRHSSGPGENNQGSTTKGSLVEVPSTRATFSQTHRGAHPRADGQQSHSSHGTRHQFHTNPGAPQMILNSAGRPTSSLGRQPHETRTPSNGLVGTPTVNPGAELLLVGGLTSDTNSHLESANPDELKDNNDNKSTLKLGTTTSTNKQTCDAGAQDKLSQHLGDLAGKLVSKNTYGQTYLHFIASRSQSGSTLYKILDHATHLIGERDIFYRTARDVAIQFNLTNNVQVLDKFIIDLFINNKTYKLWQLLGQGYSPLIHVSDSDGNDIMLILKLLKLDRMVHQLLQMADFQRWRDELHTFIRHGYSAGVSELIKRHRDLVGAKSVHARNSLHLAVLFDRLDMIDELIRADTTSVHATDNMGRTPLHYVFGLHQKNGEMIRDKLIAFGANIEARDVRMRTPKYYYIFRREIEEILRIELELN